MQTKPSAKVTVLVLLKPTEKKNSAIGILYQGATYITKPLPTGMYTTVVLKVAISPNTPYQNDLDDLLFKLVTPFTRN